MCTVTVIPCKNGIRMGCNRDESPLRPAALLPRVVTGGMRRAVMPIDPVAGGTWIAANDAGLVATLLNVYETPFRPDTPRAPRSRGTIIPWLMESATLSEAHAKAASLDCSVYSAFRLVLADRRAVAELYAPGDRVEMRAPTPIERPLLFTSSGLGDGVVDPPRRALFNEIFVPGVDWRAQQEAYHRHFWPDRRHLSVCMLRPNARTVSYTAVELESDRVTMLYHPEVPDAAVEPVAIALELSRDPLPGISLATNGRDG